MCYNEYKRQVIKRGTGVPTIPTSTDHNNGDWLDNDIYEGELYLDTATGLTYTRNGTDIIPAGSGAENFANADLVLDGTRLHDLNGNAILIADNPSASTTEYFTLGSGASEIGYGASGSVNKVSVQSSDISLFIAGVQMVVISTNSIELKDLVYLTNIPTYASDALAGAGGLATNGVYKTATGELRIKL